MIRPAYWTDADLHTRLTAEQREFYIGLWMLADDAGYVAWDPERVGAELYPYRSPTWRARRLPAWLDLLGQHARLLDCGTHVVIPNLPKHNHVPKPSYQNQRAHDACMRHGAPHGTTGDNGAPHGTTSLREGKGREFKGTAPRDFEGSTTTFQERMAANGVDPAIPGRKTA